jgi:hypothetical protein
MLKAVTKLIRKGLVLMGPRNFFRRYFGGSRYRNLHLHQACRKVDLFAASLSLDVVFAVLSLVWLLNTLV